MKSEKIKIKNWGRFQHFKDRRPPWIKLYRELLDDPDWFELDGDSAKALVMFWLIASETDGYLPDIKRLSFRLRVTEQKVKSIIDKLSHYFEKFDINAISERYQLDAPETERETERDISKMNTSSHPPDRGEDDFEEIEEAVIVAEKIPSAVISEMALEFWDAYPGRRKREQAKCADWIKANIKTQDQFETLMDRLGEDRMSADWAKNSGEFIPAPIVWLRKKRHLDPPAGDDMPMGDSDDACRAYLQSISRSPTDAEKIELYGYLPPDMGDTPLPIPPPIRHDGWGH